MVALVVQAGYDEEDGIRMRSWEFLAMVAVVLPSSGALSPMSTVRLPTGDGACMYRRPLAGLNTLILFSSLDYESALPALP